MNQSPEHTVPPLRTACAAAGAAVTVIAVYLAVAAFLARPLTAGPLDPEPLVGLASTGLQILLGVLASRGTWRAIIGDRDRPRRKEPEELP